jgi:HlyD family secretion protein
MKFPDFRNRRTRLAAIAAALLIVLAGASLAFKLVKHDTKIATYKVSKGEFVIDISQSGELDATRSVSVSQNPRRWDQVRIINMVPDGTQVKEGDFLIQFDTTNATKEVTDRTNEVEQANAELASTKASIESSTKQLENAFKSQQYDFESNKLTYELAKFEADLTRREMELTFKKSELSLEQAKQKIESQKIIDKATLGRSELRVKQAVERLKEAQTGLADLTIKAPKSGLVVLREIWTPSGRQKVKVGDSPWPGQELIAIPDLSEMKVKTKVNEVDISRVKRNQPVIVTLDALPGPLFAGKVTSIATLAKREGDSEVKVFDVEVIVDGSHKELKPGMTAQCKIVTGKIPNTISVPLESVFDKGDTTVVYVKKHGFERRPVKLGSKNSDYVIIEEGLKPGDEVCLRDPTVRLEDIGKEAPKAKESNSKPSGSSRQDDHGGRPH